MMNLRGISLNKIAKLKMDWRIRMTKNLLTIGASCIMLFAACAKNPSDIAPAHSDAAAYSTKSCADLGRTYTRINAQLGRAVDQQQKAASDDMVNVIVGLFVPFGFPAFFFIKGDQTVGQIANLKGQKAAIEASMTEKGC